MLSLIILLCVGVASAQINSAPNSDPTYGGIFNTASPAFNPDEPTQYQADKQDAFDFKLMQSVFSDNQAKNVILSPLAVKLLLTLLAEAAGQDVTSKTRTELEQVLPYNKSLYDAKEYFKKVLNSLGTQSEEYKVNFATKMFVDKNVSPNQRFGAIVQHNYLSDIENLSFDDARGSANHINKWIQEATNGRIKDLVTEDSVSNSIVLLINALYFEGAWRFPFNKTFTSSFTTGQGKKVDKTFMERTGTYYYYYSKHLGAKMLRIPYSGRRYSMYIILPEGTNTLDNVISRLTAESVRNEVWHMDEVEVHTVLPKFKFDSSINLNEAVRKLGIKEIFENSATLPVLARGGATEGKLKVSNIIQKSGIVVDEKGTTAWSATEIELVNKFGGDPREFVADRPFMFYIEDDTTFAKLFSGVVNHPE